MKLESIRSTGLCLYSSSDLLFICKPIIECMPSEIACLKELSELQDSVHLLRYTGTESVPSHYGTIEVLTFNSGSNLSLRTIVQHLTFPEPKLRFLHTAVQIVKAVEFLHGHGYAHGGISLRRFLLDTGRCLLIPCNRTVTSKTAASVLPLNNLFASPEQLLGQHLQEPFAVALSSDLWALGLVLGQMGSLVHPVKLSYRGTYAGRLSAPPLKRVYKQLIVNGLQLVSQPYYRDSFPVEVAIRALLELGPRPPAAEVRAEFEALIKDV